MSDTQQPAHIQLFSRLTECARGCPYLQWTYGLDGELSNTPLEECFAELNHNALNLVALPTEVRRPRVQPDTVSCGAGRSAAGSREIARLFSYP